MTSRWLDYLERIATREEEMFARSCKSARELQRCRIEVDPEECATRVDSREFPFDRLGGQDQIARDTAGERQDAKWRRHGNGIGSVSRVRGACGVENLALRVMEAVAHGACAAHSQQELVQRAADRESPTRFIPVDVIGEPVAAGMLDAFACEVARAHERIDRKQVQLALAKQLARDGLGRARPIVQRTHAPTPRIARRAPLSQSRMEAGHSRSSTPC